MKTLTALITSLVALLIAGLSRPCSAQSASVATSTSAATTASANRSTPGAVYKLTVVVPVDKRSGELRIGIANSEETFSGESYRTKALAVPASGEVSVTFDSLVAGRYAVRVFQDMNDNQKMDFSGPIPAEPFGFSNVTVLMAPPTFGQCAFDLTENKTIEIRLMEM